MEASSVVRPWYKKKRYLIPSGLLGLAVVATASAGGSSVPSAPQSNTAAVEQAIQTVPAEPQASIYKEIQPSSVEQAVSIQQKSVAQPQQPAQAVTTKPQASTYTEIQPSNTASEKPQATAPLSNDNYYTNTAGNEVHSPAYAPSAPAGASAVCRDGTYSFSQSRSGTCSHHGGVASWL